jgi:hypothetical protein
MSQRSKAGTVKNGVDPSQYRVVAVKEQVSCSVGGESVILNVKDGVYYGLNEVGSRVWTLVQEPRTILEIRDQLLEAYDVDPEACLKDLLVLLHRLEQWNLVVLQNGDSPSC